MYTERLFFFHLAVVADMAQLVEQRIRNAWVPGSSPGIGSKLKIQDYLFLERHLRN